MARKVHDFQGSLLDGFPQKAETIESEGTLLAPADEVEAGPIANEEAPLRPSGEVGSIEAKDTSSMSLDELALYLDGLVVPIEIAKRAEALYKVLGHISHLSKTGIYKNMDENPWFQRRLERRHGGSAQQHIDEVMETRQRIGGAAETDFKKAYGVEELVEAGFSKELAEQMASDFYNGTNVSGHNPDRKSFQLSHADSKNYKKRSRLQKDLKKQAERFK